MIRVVIADDHPMLRHGIKAILADAPDVQVVAEASSGDDVLAKLAGEAADIALLDVSMPGPGILALLRRIAEGHPRTRAIVLSAHPEEQYAVRALKAGAAGYVTKDRSAEELLTAVRKVAKGGRYVSNSLAQLLASELGRAGESQAHETLSEREFEVLRLLGSGKSVKEVAAALDVSPKTVSTYRARLLEKMKLKTTADLIRYTVEHSL